MSLKGLDLTHVRLTFTQALLLYVLMVIVLFADVLFFERTLNPETFVPDELGVTADEYRGPAFCNDSGAVTWAFHPWNEFVHKSLVLDGEVPLWNPFQGTGMPLAANFQSGVFSPLQWPFFLAVNDHWWDILYVIRLLLAGIFTFLFLKLHSVSDLSAWMAGLFFMFSGYLIDYINMNHLSVELLIPVCFYSFERFLQKRDRASYTLAVVSLSLSLLGGMPEATFFLWIFLGGYAAVRLFRNFRVGFIFLSGSIFALAGLNSSFLLLPGFEYLLNSHSKHFIHGWGTTSFSIEALIGYFVPYFFGPPGPLGWHSEISKSFGVPSAIGVTSLTLSLVSLFAGKKKIRIFFAVWLFLSVAKIFGFPGIHLLGALPLFDTLIFTKYLQPSVAFTVAVLAGFGLNLLVDRPKTPAVLVRYPALVVMLFIFAMGIAYSSEIANSGKPLVAIAILVCIAFSLLICALLIWASHLFEKNRSLALLLLLLAGVLETGGLALRLHPPRPAEVEPAFLEDLEREIEGFRLFGDYILFPNTATPNQIEDLRVLDPLLPNRFGSFAKEWLGKELGSLLSFRQVLDYEDPALDLLGVKYLVSRRDLRNLLLRQHPLTETAGQVFVEGIERPVERISIGVPVEFSFPYSVARDSPRAFIHIEAYAHTSISLRWEEGSLVETQIAAGETFESTINLEAFAGESLELKFRATGDRGEILAALVPLQAGNPTLQFLRQDPETVISVFERSTALPLAYLVGEYRSALSDEAALETVLENSFRAEHTVILEGYQSAREQVLSEIRGKVELSKRTANSVSYEIESSRDGLLVISQTFFPGWQARVNGWLVPLYRANYLLTALEIPEGDSLVILEYRPGSVFWGAVLSILGIFLTLLCASMVRQE